MSDYMFLSRRELRELERKGLPKPDPAASSASESVVSPEVTNEPRVVAAPSLAVTPAEYQAEREYRAPQPAPVAAYPAAPQTPAAAAPQAPSAPQPPAVESARYATPASERVQVQTTVAPMTRRQLRELERTGAIPIIVMPTETNQAPPATPQEYQAPQAPQEYRAPQAPYATPTSEPVFSAPAVQQPVQPSPQQPVAYNPPELITPPQPATYIPATSPEPAVIIATDIAPTQPGFLEPSNLLAEPITASIVIDHVNDIGNITLSVPETGELLRTGSIELPPMSSATGEISIIESAARSDESVSQEAASGYVSNIAPMPVKRAAELGLGRPSIVPVKNQRLHSQLFWAIATGILAAVVGGLFLAAFMLGVF